VCALGLRLAAAPIVGARVNEYEAREAFRNDRPRGYRATIEPVCVILCVPVAWQIIITDSNTKKARGVSA